MKEMNFIDINVDLVSIIIPTYKGYSKLSRAIDSVFAQTYRNIEVMVVDDNASDSIDRRKTKEVVATYIEFDNFIYLKHDKNLNGAAARNTGISKAKGLYIAFLDDDDYYLPNRIESCINFLKNHKDYIGVYVGVDCVDETDKVISKIRPTQDLSTAKLLKDEMAIGTGSNIFLRSNIIKKLNGFDEDFDRRQDIEFMIRACHLGKIGYINEKLIIKSINGTFNYPKYEIMAEILDQFEQKFKLDIDSLGNNRNAYYATKYRALLSVAFYEHNKNEINEATHLLKQYDMLSLKEKLLRFLYMHNLQNNAFLKWMIMIYKKMMLI